MNDEVYFELITSIPDVDDPELARPLSPLQERLGKVLLEDAKRLSVNSRFQDDVRRLREQWHISVPDDTLPSFDLEEAVRSYWQNLNAQDISKLKHEMRSLLARYGLDQLRHWGLALGAVFFGITFNNVRDHWDKLESLAIKGAPRLLQTDDLMRPDRERLALLAVIKWLWLYITQKDRSLKFPEPLYRIIDEAVFMENGPEVWGDLEKVGEYVQRTLSGEPVPVLLIPVNEYTSLEDVKRTWPLIEQCRTAFMHGSLRERGEWTTYARDVELMMLLDECANYDDAIREYHRLHPNEKLIVDGIITFDIQDLVRQAVHRARERSA